MSMAMQALVVTASWALWILIWVVKMALWIVGAMFFGLWWCQGRLLYLPNHNDRKGEQRKVKYNQAGYRSPDELSMEYEDLYLDTKDGVKVHCWFIPQAQRSVRPTIMFFHGNAGNIGFRLLNAKAIFNTTGANVMLVEYRGYGNSTGNASEKGLAMDAQAAFDHLCSREDVDSTKVFVFGRSLGGAVAVSLAYNNPEKVRGLILENTFLSIDKTVVVIWEKMGFKRCQWLVRFFLYFYLTNHWHTEKRVPYLTCPMLFMSGLMDELVPPQHMRTLYESAEMSSYRKFHGVFSGSHNDTYLQEPDVYNKVFSEFISHVS